MKRSLLLLSVFFISSVFLAGNVFALPVQINMMNFYSDGASYAPDGTVIPGPWGSQDLSPVGTAVTPDDIPDSEAVSRVSEWINTSTGGYIYDITNPTAYPYEITAVISGVDDILFMPGVGATSDFDLYSIGLHIDVFKDYSPDFSTLNGSGAGDGILLLALDGHLQTTLDANGTPFDFSLLEIFHPLTGEYTGTALLDVDTSQGLWADVYDTNTMAAPFSAIGDPEFADFTISFSLSDNTDPLYPLTWNLSGTANGIADVPEPATMFLFGLGLIGLAGIRRSRRKK